MDKDEEPGRGKTKSEGKSLEVAGKQRIRGKMYILESLVLKED